MKLVSISESTKPDKKMTAVFFNENTGRKRTIHFGSAGMDDYTLTKDKAQRQLYLERHAARENWDEPTTAGALSRWILWNKTSKTAAIADYKKRFGF
jgi:hypothetical protein